MWNRREMLNRLLQCQRAGVPATNYGLTIAYSLGIFERALEPFPAALETYKQAQLGARAVPGPQRVAACAGVGKSAAPTANVLPLRAGDGPRSGGLA